MWGPPVGTIAGGAWVIEGILRAGRAIEAKPRAVLASKHVVVDLQLVLTAPLPCKALEGSKSAVAAFCKAEGKGELFAFAVRTFGAPVACEARLKGKGDDAEKSLVCRFADGSRYSVDTCPRRPVSSR